MDYFVGVSLGAVPTFITGEDAAVLGGMTRPVAVGAGGAAAPKHRMISNRASLLSWSCTTLANAASLPLTSSISAQKKVLLNSYLGFNEENEKKIYVTKIADVTYHTLL